MHEPLDFDHLLDDILLKLKKESRRVAEFGESFREEAQVIFLSLPTGTYTNLFVSGEVIDSFEVTHDGALIFTQRLYLFGKTDSFFDALERASSSLGGEIQSEQRQQIKELLEKKLGRLAKYDMAELYEELEAELENFLNSSTKNMGRMQSYLNPKSAIVIGGGVEDVLGGFLIRISVSGSVGKLFVLPKKAILNDESLAQTELISEIQKFISQGPEVINEAV